MRRLASVLILVFLCGCGSGSTDQADTDPEADAHVSIISTTPPDKGALVDVNSRITVRFDRAVDEGSLSNTSFYLDNNTQGQITYDPATNTAVFTPSSPLGFGTTYKAALTKDVRGAEGGQMAEGHEWSFTTASAPMPSSSVLMTVALLDLSAKNNETDSSLFGLTQAMDIMGVPYVKTEDVEEALNYPMIYTTSYITSSTFTQDEKDALKGFVSNGGAVVSANVKDPDLYDLYGISGETQADNRYLLTWRVDTGEESLKYIDDPNEETISLGSSTYSNIINTRGYATGGGASLAVFDDNTIAVVKNAYGSGRAYAIGFSYVDIITRNELDLDYGAERTYTNGFEPTTDVFMLFLRGIYEEGFAYPVWKHTSPYAGKATLMITHDVDSQSSMDWMAGFADMETGHSISATYNITTHYIDDAMDGDFYTPNILKIAYLRDKGHDIQSHSVGHFSDWYDEAIFPEGAPGNTRETYSPYNDGTTTANGTVYGELEVSKHLLEADIGVSVNSFRSGHLLFNDYQIRVMEALGYEFDSSFSANDVLTNFPYIIKYDRSLSGEASSVYEIPMTISDVGIDEDNYPEFVQNWHDVLTKNSANFAPTVLLIHPNRDYKITAEEDLIGMLPSDITVLSMASFGTFWKDRDRLKFSSSVENNTLTITISDETVFPLEEGVSLFVKGGMALSGISVEKTDSAPVGYTAVQYNGDDVIIYGLTSN